MGILTNLLSLADQQAQEKRDEERNRYATIANTEGIQPAIKNWAIDQLVGMAPKKSGIGQLGDLFKGMAGKGGGGQSPAAMQSFQQALQSTGAAPKTVQSPTGVAPGPQGPITGAPGSTESLQQMERTRQPGSAPMTIGGVAPSMMLSPQEQLAVKLDETRATEKIKRDLAEQGEAGMRRIQSDADEFDTRRKEKVRSDLALKAWNARGELIKAGYPEDAANEISGWKEHSQIKGPPKLISGSDPQLQAYAKRTGVEIDPGADYWTYLDPKGDVEQALKGPPKAAKADEEKGTRGEVIAAERVVMDYEAAQRTGRKSKYTEADYKGSKEFLAKYNRPPATNVAANAAKLDPKSLDFAAEQYLSTGRMPPAGMGAAGQIRTGQVLKRAAELADERGDTGRSVVAHQAAVKAGQASLTQLRKQYDNVTAFEKTAKQNLARAIQKARAVIDAGSIPANTVFRGAARQFGSGAQAAADAARQVAYTEVARVLSNPGSSAGLTEGARHEAEGIMQGGYTIQQLIDVADLLNADMDTRKSSLEEQMKSVQDDIIGGATPKPEAAPSTPTTGPLVTPPRAGAKLDGNTAKQYLRAIGWDGKSNPTEQQQKQAFDKARADKWQP